jgi:hypothetical protein
VQPQLNKLLHKFETGGSVKVSSGDEELRELQGAAASLPSLQPLCVPMSHVPSLPATRTERVQLYRDQLDVFRAQGDDMKQLMAQAQQDAHEAETAREQAEQRAAMAEQTIQQLENRLDQMGEAPLPAHPSRNGGGHAVYLFAAQDSSAMR